MTVQYMLWSRVKGAGEEHRVKVYILRAGLARRLVVMVTDVGIVPFLYCLRQSLFNAVVLGIYSNILLGLGPLRKQFLATYIKDLFLGKMLRSNNSRKWMNHGKPVCHPDDVIYVIENWFVLKTNSRTCRFSVLKKKGANSYYQHHTCNECEVDLFSISGLLEAPMLINTSSNDLFLIFQD